MLGLMQVFENPASSPEPTAQKTTKTTQCCDNLFHQCLALRFRFLIFLFIHYK